MAQTDYYKVLGIEKSATQADVKTAFKKLARQYHPDVNPDNPEAEKKFKEISEAYEVLGDEKKRRQYDQMGSFNFGSGGPQNPFQQGYWQQGNFNDVDLEDIFGDIFGFGGPKRGRKAGHVNFNFGGGPGGARSAAPRDGSDIHWVLPVDFLDAVNGCEKQILLTDGKKIKVKIPAGVDTGSKVRINGKGNPGVAGGAAGDLIIETQVQPHSDFSRDGDDIHLNVDVPLKNALEGGTLAVATIDGKVQIKIPEGSQSGQKMRLKGKGVANVKSKFRGDQYVHLLIKYPDKMSATDKEQLLAILAKY